MHLRFDGKLGFPGGLVETEEDVETGKYCTLIKKKENFPHILGNSEGSGAKSYMTYRPPHIMVKIFVHFLIYSIRKPLLIYDFAPDPI